MVNLNGKSINFKNGFAEINLANFEQYNEFILDKNDFSGWLFRGHTFSSWELYPSSYREFKKYSTKLSYNEVLKFHQYHFKLDCRGRLDSGCIAWNNEDELWAIGQHYGLWTPLLDFTASPAVALFFATNEEKNIDIKEGMVNEEINKRIKMLNEPRTVYALKIKNFYENSKLLSKVAIKWLLLRSEMPVLEPMYKIIDDFCLKNNEDGIETFEMLVEQQDIWALTALDYVEKFLPKIISPLAGENKRIVSQRGIFVKWKGNYTLQECVRKALALKALNVDDICLLKINIPNHQRDKILGKLYEMNVNYLSLFPDIEGASMYQNWKMTRLIN